VGLCPTTGVGLERALHDAPWYKNELDIKIVDATDSHYPAAD
jgi:hypothetical protein